MRRKLLIGLAVATFFGLYIFTTIHFFELLLLFGQKKQSDYKDLIRFKQNIEAAYPTLQAGYINPQPSVIPTQKITPTLTNVEKKLHGEKTLEFLKLNKDDYLLNKNGREYHLNFISTIPSEYNYNNTYLYRLFYYVYQDRSSGFSEYGEFSEEIPIDQDEKILSYDVLKKPFLENDIYLITVTTSKGYRSILYYPSKTTPKLKLSQYEHLDAYLSKTHAFNLKEDLTSADAVSVAFGDRNIYKYKFNISGDNIKLEHQ